MKFISRSCCLDEPYGPRASCRFALFLMQVYRVQPCIMIFLNSFLYWVQLLITIFLNSAPSVRGLYPCPRLPIPWLSQLKPLSNILRTADALRISITEFVYLGIYCWCNKTADSTNASIETWSRWRDWVNLTVIIVSSDCAELLHTFFLHLNKNYETWFLNWKKNHRFDSYNSFTLYFFQSGSRLLNMNYVICL